MIILFISIFDVLGFFLVFLRISILCESELIVTVCLSAGILLTC